MEKKDKDSFMIKKLFSKRGSFGRGPKNDSFFYEKTQERLMIRLATIKDKKIVIELNQYSLNDFPLFEKDINNLIMKKRITLSYDDIIPVGFISYIPCTVNIMILNLSMHPSFKESQHVLELLQALESSAKQLDYKNIVMQVSDSFNKLHFFHRKGYIKRQNIEGVLLRDKSYHLLYKSMKPKKD